MIVIFKRGLRVHEDAESEVSDLNNEGLWVAQQKVLGLRVAVDDVVGVHELHCFGQLANDVGGVALGEVPFLTNAVKQGAARGELEHCAAVRRCGARVVTMRGRARAASMPTNRSSR